MKFISWNTNGLRACVGKGFLDAFNALDADFFCLQETKLQAGQIDLPLEGYSQYWNYAEKKGYSGTAIFAKQAPVSVRYGLGQPELDTEGRLITLEYPGFFLVTCYTPNAQRGLARIDHRLEWDESFRTYLSELDKEKPDAGFTDSFRRLHPDATGAYTWWSYMFNARANNAGWRIDYFLVSDRIADKITATPIYSDIQGSDHCPVGLEIEL